MVSNFKKMSIVLAFIVLVVFTYFFIGNVQPAEKITWGMNFSQKHARDLGLDWKETYSAMLSDLGAKNLKVAAHWDLLEPEDGKFYFDDLDWQINEASNRGAEILLVIGMKTTRWPECHIPDWAQNLSKKDQQKEILIMLKEVVLRYQDSKAVSRWQVENEPFFPFGNCPWVDKEFFIKEVAEVRSLDLKKRPVIVGENGESFWFTAAKIGDIVGTTMYRKVWFSTPNFLKKYLGPFKELGFYLKYPWPPAFYGRKAKIIEKLFGKRVIGVELQAEPWCQNLLYNCLADEQKKTMDLKQLKDNIEFAKKTGFDTFYLWGSEWMYWLKEKQQEPEIWQEVKKLF